ncbi:MULTISPECIES: sensor domain-containing diguanylate cyclase [Methylobacterium]|uniref:sensor domain-containing diguanylate cyclase n=1 Tax=Methylobacterium TaxID=407 RepID=UPI0009E70673|nr:MULTISPECIES: sensor domain-containing diguanylate cyclase [Methylobacterium]MCI9879897.1 sensor domain-containing diguanylate cyclase [Methylobacterium goesingense]
MYPKASNEADRLRALQELDLLEAEPEPHFDALCRTAAALFDMPISYVSLVAQDHQRFVAKCGFDLDGTAREGAFCNYAILSDAVFVVEDARTDPRFRDSPLVVGPPHVRFYAGAPLVTQVGLRVGILCVLDRVPRRFTPEDCARLQDLASVVCAQLSLHRAKAELREREAHYRLLAENSSDMVIWATLDTVRRYVSPASRSLLGYEAEELIGTKPLDQVHPADAEAYGRLLDDLCHGRVTRAVATQRYRRKDGSWIWVEVNFNLTYEAEGGRATGYVAAARDISARKEAEFQIAHMARHDALTDLANRTLFHERLVQELAVSQRRGASFAVLCLDLDRFKVVNDTLGHQAGDALLRKVADRLRTLVRAEDTVARIGGDEFVIIQTGPVVGSSIRTLAQRLIEVVSQPIDLDGTSVTVGVSVGVAVAPQDGTDPDLLCRHADLALFRAKDAGRNTFRLYEAGMRFGPA